MDIHPSIRPLIVNAVFDYGLRPVKGQPNIWRAYSGVRRAAGPAGLFLEQAMTDPHSIDESANQSPPPAPSPSPYAPLPEGVGYCTFADFEKVRLTAAEIIAAEPHPAADRLLKLQIRLGDREKQICAGIRGSYEPEDLIGKRIVVVDNLEPRKLRGEISNGMLLAAHAPDGSIALVTLDKPGFPTGGKVS